MGGLDVNQSYSQQKLTPYGVYKSYIFSLKNCLTLKTMGKASKPILDIFSLPKNDPSTQLPLKNLFWAL